MKPIAEQLTFKQKYFCDEYLIDRNATRAALQAGYSESTALNGQLMKFPKIQMYLRERTAQLTTKLHIEHQTILHELSKVAFGNISNYFLPNGTAKPLHQLSADELAAVQSITISPDGTVKIKMYNKMQALEKIARHTAFYTPEESVPEKVYVYLDPEDMTSDDQFEDESEEEENDDEQYDQDTTEPQPAKPRNEVEENEPYLKAVDGAGIPYRRNPDHFIDLDETPAQLIARVNQMQQREQAAAAKTGTTNMQYP